MDLPLSAIKLNFRFISLSAIPWLLLFATSIHTQDLTVSTKFQKDSFELVYENRAADILVSSDDFKVVQIAAHDLSSDVERVTGKAPVIRNAPSSARSVVIVGTLKSPFIDELVKRRKIDVSRIRGKWESFLIATVSDPLPGIRSSLVIAGSDRRGTAFGVYELSQRIGVSPWYWWADVTPEHKDNLVISQGVTYGGEPSVKYRGIFLNDEDWGLQPWAAKTFEPETGDIGPKTYAKIFELLLRLKANTIWPAMHEVTRPFNSIVANRQVADDYAIVMGSSHAEPMLRNNVGEWKAPKEDYNFVTNSEGVTRYWEERVKENGQYENIYTLGMRGIHDSPIQGTKDQAQRIPLLEKIFAVQRSLLGKYVNQDVESVPQIFCPYKEVLDDYRAALKVPDDVTIVFPDDNFGYIRQFPTADERKRKGGFGVYYHISYLGRPISYLWLNSAPPALIWEEMSKAYDNGMRQIWILNVGDIKPGEIGTELFLEMAYDAKRWTASNVNEFLKTWAARQFGESDSKTIASIMSKYYALGFQRRPEHLQWNLPGEKPVSSDLLEDEKLQRMAQYSSIKEEAEKLFAAMQPQKKNAFYELVLYPVRSAALANERYFTAELAEQYRSSDSSRAHAFAQRSIAADAAIQTDAKYFNENLAGGKWLHIMSPEMNAGQWTSMRSTPPKPSLTDFPTTSDHRDVTSGAADPPPLTIAPADGVSISPVDGFTWHVIKGLGHTGSVAMVLPNVARTFSGDLRRTPSIEYSFNTKSAGASTITFFLLPTHSVVNQPGLRFAFSMDGAEPRIVTIDNDVDVSSRKWSFNVLSNQTSGCATVELPTGRHTLRVYAVESGVVLDRITVSPAVVSNPNAADK